MAIALPRRRINQPQGRVCVEWNQPLAKGLVFALDVAGLRNAVDGALITRVGSYSGVRSVRTGRALRAYSEDDRFFCSISPIANTSPLAGYFCGRAFSSNTLRKRMFRLFNSANGSLFLFDYGDSVVNQAIGGIQIAGSIFPNVSVIGSTVAGDAVVYLGHDGASGLELEVNGVLNDSFVGNPAARAGTIDALSIGNNTTSNPWNGTIFAGYFWTRVLSVEERRELDANPWQLFRDDPVRIYSLPSGGSLSFTEAPSVTARTGNSYTLGGTLSEEGHVYAVAVLPSPTDTAPTTPQQIILGHNGDDAEARGAGDAATNASGVFSFNVTGGTLGNNPIHDLHVVGRAVAAD
jgi:hypothetical protein